jgi:adenine specific DNA methylase Mod
MNRLLFGDNLKWLRDPKIFPDASVDLVYLDPPFNSNADYNVLFREASGEASQTQFHAFTDTWNWADAAETYAEFRHRERISFHPRRVCSKFAGTLKI